MDDHTFTYNGATVTLARRTNRHAMLIDRIVVALADGDEEDDAASLAYKRLFARAVVQTEAVEGELGVALPSATASPADLRAGYEAFMEADGTLGDAYYRELAAVNAPLGPRPFLPPDELAEDERKNSPSAAKRGGASGAPSSGDS